MCSVTAGLMAASAVAGAYGQYSTAKAQAAAANAQADAAEQNAKIENRKQEQIADKYAQEDLKRRAQARLTQGRTNANAGAAGLGTESGTSAFDLLNSSQQAYQNDQYISLVNQRNDNYTSRVQEANYINQANAYRAEAKNIRRNANIGIASTILGTAASISGSVGGSDGGSDSSASSYSNTTSVNDYTDANYTSGKGFSFNKKNYNYRNTSPTKFF